MVCPLVVVTLDTILLFWVSKTYYLTGLVPPFSYPEDHVVSLETPESGRTHGGPEPDDGKHSPSDWSCSWKALAF